nr:putative galacturonosyltransferase 4 [Quercus suber]
MTAMTKFEDDLLITWVCCCQFWLLLTGVHLLWVVTFDRRSFPLFNGVWCCFGGGYKFPWLWVAVGGYKFHVLGAYDKLKAMEQTVAKGKQLQDDCASVVKKLRAMLHSTEEQLRVHKKQTIFLTQLTAKMIPKGLHCLPLRLTTEYYTLNSSQHDFPNQEKLEDPQLYRYALFSDNVLPAAVVVNSTITYAKDPSKHVFHIVTDRLNYATMRMWFLVNPPGKASIQVQNIEEFTWLNASYSPVLKQLGSQSMGNVNGAVETCGESFHRFDRIFSQKSNVLCI